MSYNPYRTVEPLLLDSSNVILRVRQHPEHALVIQSGKEKFRKPVDPPPIVQMKVEPNNPAQDQWLVSPYLFMIPTLVDVTDGTDRPLSGKEMLGQLSSSLHRLKDTDNSDGGFFVFGDISIRKAGTYLLRFCLFDLQKGQDAGMRFITSTDTNHFIVHTNKDFPGLTESTHLSRTFSDQGVRLRLTRGRSRGLKRAFPSSSPPQQQLHDRSQTYVGTVQQPQYIKRQRQDSEYDQTQAYSRAMNGAMTPYTNAGATAGSYAQPVQSPYLYPPQYNSTAMTTTPVSYTANYSLGSQSTPGQTSTAVSVASADADPRMMVNDPLSNMTAQNYYYGDSGFSNPQQNFNMAAWNAYQ